MTWFTKRRATAALAGLATSALLLSGCAGNNSSDSADSSDSAATSGGTFIYVTSDPIGQNEFLKSGQTGIEAVAKQFKGESKTYESKDDETRRTNLEAAAAEAPDVVVMIGFQFTDMAVEVANQYPDQKFLLVDATTPDAPENLYTATFHEHEASYLLGIAAAELTESNKVGSVMSLDTDQLRKFHVGFAEGAKATKADVEVVEPQIIGGDNPFADPARGKEQAKAYAATGVDQVFAVAAASNAGVMEAGKEDGFYTYGVDANQCGLAAGSVVDGTIKAVDQVILTVVAEILDGKATSEATTQFGLKEGGMTVVSLTDDAENSGCVVMEHPEIVEKMAAAAEDIKNGDIKVTDYTQQ